MEEKPDLIERFERIMRRLASALIVAVTVSAGLIVLHWVDKEQEPRHFTRADEVTDLLMLPSQPLEAAGLLGSTRSEVRERLGAPEAQGPSSDVFDLPPRVTIHYVDGKAHSIGIFGRNAGRNLRQARRWMKLPGTGTVVIDGREYRTIALDADEILLEPVPDQQRVAPQPVAKRQRRWSAARLLRDFPTLPKELESECRAESRGAGTLFCLSNADARLLYDLDEKRDVRVLTILDPPGVGTFNDCRGYLKDAIPGAELSAIVDEPGQSAQYFTMGSSRYAFVWTQPGPKTRAGCAVMACVESEDPNRPTHGPCVPKM